MEQPLLASAERLTAGAADGVELAIHRVRGNGPAVLLLHGLGGNRFSFLFARRSLAQHLAERGFDCYVPELRGAGQSGTRHWRYDLEDYLRWDLPAILSKIREVSGRDQVHWIGHSMGGVLLMCHGIRNEKPGLARGITIGSALNYRVGGSAFEGMLAARSVIERLSLLPFGAFTHLLAPLMGRVGNPLELFNFWPTNAEPEIVRAVHANAFGAIPVSLLRSLATTFEPEGLTSRDGALRYFASAARFPAPLLLLAGSEDRQCPVSTVEATAEAIGRDRAKVESFGRAFGHEDEYGHFDLVLGRRAPTEVWPRLEAWLRAG
jgi:pimeloyl-ACP methyl ester carboxylesterase